MFLDPAIGSNFFGRSDILNLLKKRIDGLRYGCRQNVAIIGPPHYGKTSIIYRFINDNTFNDVVPIYIEVKPQGFLNFAEKFISTLLFQYLKALEHKLDDVIELSLLANDRMPKTARSVKKIEALIKDNNLTEAYAALFELPAIAYAEMNLRPVIIIDEFHRIEDFGIRDAFSVLGKNIMFQKDTMYIVTSSYVNQAKKILSEKLSLLFGNFEIYELGTFDASTARDFVDFRLGQKKLLKGLNDFLVAFTDGHPFYLDCILLKLKEYFNLRLESDQTEAITITFAELLFDSKGILNQHFAGSISDVERADQRHISLLFSIANGNRKIQTMAASSHLKPGEIRPILQKLISSGWVLKYGVFYVIRDKVFEFWLKNVHQNKECRLDTDYESKISRFKVEIKNHIEAFLNASKENYVQKLTELFRSFNGELIQLDKRCFVFPDFKKALTKNTENQDISYLFLSNDRCAWAFLITLQPLTDERIMHFLNYCREQKKTLKRKIIISSSEMDPNTKLLAKRATAWIWTSKELNELLDIAVKQRMVFPHLNKPKSDKAQILDTRHLETA